MEIFHVKEKETKLLANKLPGWVDFQIVKTER